MLPSFKPPGGSSLASGSVEFIATAGAINHTDEASALFEATRVLTIGWVAAYDFSAGRRLSAASNLPTRHADFERAFPPGLGYALGLRSLPAAGVDFRLLTYEQFVVHAEMTAETYVEYALSESGVELVLARGVETSEVPAICERLFCPVFDDQARNVEFDALFAIWRKKSQLILQD